MADNTQLNINTTSGDIIATEDIGGVKHELVIVEFSDDVGGATKVSPTNPLPVSATIDTTGLATSSKQDIGNTSLASIDAKLTNPLPISGTVSTGGLTDTQLRATPVPISGTVTATIDVSTLLTQSDFDTKTGSLTETAPTTDTASSGLNGRLQRIAQRITSLITALGSPFQAGGSIGNTSFIATQATAANLNVAAVLNAETTKVIGTVNANVNAPTTILNGKTTVSTAGSRTTLAGATTCKSVTIKALSTNTGFIYVGNSTVTSANGFQLLAGDTVSLDIADLTTVNIDSSVNGEGCTYIANN